MRSGFVLKFGCVTKNLRSESILLDVTPEDEDVCLTSYLKYHQDTIHSRTYFNWDAYGPNMCNGSQQE